MPAPQYNLLLKEIDLLNGNIKNMDEIIHKTKNFALLIWGGALSVLIGSMDGTTQYGHVLLFLTGLVPVLFWIIECKYRRHLFYMSMRDRVISRFINSPSFDGWVKAGHADPKFPLYDPAGWIYTVQAKDDFDFVEEYLVDHREIGFWKIFLYKDAKWFYSIMIFISFAMGIFFG